MDSRQNIRPQINSTNRDYDDDNWQGFQKIQQPTVQNINKVKISVKQNQSNLKKKEISKSKQVSQQKNIIKFVNKTKQHKKPDKIFQNSTVLPEINKQKTTNFKTQVQKQQNNQYQKNNYTLQQSPHKKRTKNNASSLPSKKIPYDFNIPRIPIIVKYDDQNYMAYKIVYKGFAPKSSDSYVRTLKDINFYKKLKEIHQKQNQKQRLSSLKNTLNMKNNNQKEVASSSKNTSFSKIPIINMNSNSAAPNLFKRENDLQNGIQFNSKFQSGNLFMAYQGWIK